MGSPLQADRAVIVPASPLSAYRQDIERLGVAPPDRAAAWLLLATGLAHRADGGTSRSDAPADAEYALEVLRGVEEMEDAGFLALAFTAATLLHGVLGARPTGNLVLEVGRALALQGRLSWKWGDLDGAEERYRRVVRMGRAAPELRVRGWLGLAVVNQLRGNHPALRRYATRARRLARCERLHSLEAVSHHLLMVSAVAAGAMDEALFHGWQAFEVAVDDRDGPAERLLNLTQLIADSGYPNEARAGFRHVLALAPSARLTLPAWGGLALAASFAGAHAEVREAARHIRSISQRHTLPYQTAAAWTEVAAAFTRLGRPDEAEVALLQARRQAEARFHEITHRLDLIEHELNASVGAPETAAHRLVPRHLTSRGASVIHAVGELAETSHNPRTRRRTVAT